MVEFKTKKPDIKLLFNGKVELSFIAEKTIIEQISSLKQEDLTIQIKEYREKRSMSQNAYMWVLLDELAKKLQTNKEELYKIYIKDYGVFEILPIRQEAVESFKRRWGSNGLGWFTEDLGESKLNGYIKLIAYYGSSTYNSKEMSRVIDAIVTDCEEQGINTMTMSEIMLLENENGG